MRRPVKPVGPNSSLKTWEGDQWKIGGGTTWGWFTYDPQSNLDLLRHGESGHLESQSAPRRQQVVDDHLRS